MGFAEFRLKILLIYLIIVLPRLQHIALFLSIWINLRLLLLYQFVFKLKKRLPLQLLLVLLRRSRRTNITQRLRLQNNLGILGRDLHYRTLVHHHSHLNAAIAIIYLLISAHHCFAFSLP